MAERGVNGFDHFCRNKSGSTAGTKPGSTSGHAFEDELGFFVYIIVVVGGTTAERTGNDGG